MTFCLSVKILPTTEPIKFSILGKLHFGSGMVLGYFFIIIIFFLFRFVIQLLLVNLLCCFLLLPLVLVETIFTSVPAQCTISYRQIDRQRYRQTDRKTDRQTDRQRDREEEKINKYSESKRKNEQIRIERQIAEMHKNRKNSKVKIYQTISLT